VANKTTNRIGVALGLPRKVADLLLRAQGIHDAMAANSKTLPSPSPALAVLQTDISTLATKEAAAKTRTPGAVIDRDQALTVLRVDLNSERLYVESVVNANPASAAEIVADAGMSLFKVAAHSKPPLAVKAGATSGTVKIVAKATQGAKANDWQMSTDGGKTWIDLPSTTKASTSVANLTPSTTVQFRQRAITKAGEADWSLPVPHVVA
jgi:hypothetical protein